LKARHVLTAERYRNLAIKARRLTAGRTAADAEMMKAYADECDAAADEADRIAARLPAVNLPP